MHAKGAAKKSLPLLYVAIIILFGLVTYLNTFYNGFVWDDHYLILKNPFLHRPNVLKIFIQDLDSTGFARTLFYRPLQNLSYVIDYRAWGFNPLGYHLTNTLIHILNAVLVFFLIENIAKKRMVSFLTALFFVSHPIHYGAVTYLSGRADSLFALFFLASFLAFIKYRESPKPRFLLMCVSGFVLALLSKEMAVITIFIFVLYDVIFGKKPARPDTVKGNAKPHRLNRVLPPYLACGAILLIYGAFRLGHLRESLRSAFSGGGFSGCVLTFPLAVGRYMGTLIAPVDLCMRKSPYLAKSFWEPYVAPSLFLVALLVILGLRLKSRKREVSFFIFFFLVSLLPVSNIFVRVNAIRADHWLYIPSIGFFFLLAYFLNFILFKACKGGLKIPLRVAERVVFVSGICLAAVYSAIAIRENTYWKDDGTLFTEILTHAPEDPLARGNLGMVYLGRGEFEKALAEQEKVMRASPDYAAGYYNAGIIYFQMKDFKTSRAFFQKALEKDRSFSEPHIYLGLMYNGEKKLPEAEKEFQKAVAINPYSSPGWLNLGILKYHRGEFDTAQECFGAAIERDPQNAKAYLYLAAAYRSKAKPKEALAVLENAAKINPQSADILMDLGNTYSSFGLFEEAIGSFRKALLLSPEKSRIYYNIADTYRLKGETARAKRYLHRALAVNPSFKQAAERLEELK